jgi:hypothetical protein
MSDERVNKDVGSTAGSTSSSSELPVADLQAGLPHRIDDVDPLFITSRKSKSKRVSLSNDDRANPKTLIHVLAQEVSNYIYFPDPMPLYVTLGTLAANMMRGVPVWLMVVGPSSGGKTLAIEMLGDIERLIYVNSIKGETAFLSGSGRKDTAKNATGGLLREFKVLHEEGCNEHPGCRCISRGMLIVKDFAEVLACEHTVLSETVGALRGICDGTWGRSIGGDGGRRITWHGRIGFLGACTPQIDSKHGLIQSLGQRWVYYRHERTDGFGETQKSMNNRNREQMNAELRELIKDFVDMSGLSWDGQETREFTPEEIRRTFAMSSIVVNARSKASRDYKTKELDDIDEAEAPMRMSNALGQLYLGLEAIGLTKQYSWKVIRKVAMDSCPRLSMAVLKVIAKSGLIAVADVKEKGQLMCSKGTVVRVIEDLEVFGVVERSGGNVRLSESSAKNWKLGFGGVS